MLRDGHIHTPFCPHGSKDAFDEYIERALSLGFAELTFTEHAPLPDGFTDTAPARDSAMQAEELGAYFEEISRVKAFYKNKIKINAGLEVDFIEGFEKETADFLAKTGHLLDDSILSVHFLYHDGQYDCADYSPELFASMISRYGSAKSVYKKYYETVRRSITADLGPFKPKRIGHISLIHKFQKKYPAGFEDKQEISDILQLMKLHGCSLDCNGAGTAKPLCREPYPPEWAVLQAKSLGIPLVYGSDAHQAKELGQGLGCFPFEG
jgi:histidinol-phosphatase (PHP family)